MILYYTNREISQKLDINLARWKRWSREFLPPDPLGGMQSGYARQYVFKDLFRVYLGGHLLSHLKLSVAQSQMVLTDLSPWLKKNGFWELNAAAGTTKAISGQLNAFRIYFCPLRAVGAKTESGFGYLIRKTVGIRPSESSFGRQIMETIEETLIHTEGENGLLLLDDPHVRMINLSAQFTVLVDMLQH